jgi:hypothetical protein
MITISLDKGYARIESWDEVLSRPGFKTDVDPKTTKLASIIGSYAFSTFQPCGLSSCHTPHGRGYLVVTSDGYETNIGSHCGKKYFSVDFERMAKVFDRDLRAQEQREALTAFQHQIPAVKARIQQLKEGEMGANWIRKKLVELSSPSALPTKITQLVARLAKLRNGALTISRLATPEELERFRAQGQPAKAGETYVEEPAGQLEGLAALYEENDLRELLVERMRPMEVVEAADVEQLPDKARRELAKWVPSVEPTLAQAEAAIAAGRRLLTQSNLRQLAQFVESKEDRRALNAYLERLPA